MRIYVHCKQAPSIPFYVSDASQLEKPLFSNVRVQFEQIWRSRKNFISGKNVLERKIFFFLRLQ